MNCPPGFAFLNYTAYAASEMKWQAYGFRIAPIPINPLTRLFGAPDCVSCRLLLANFLFWSAVFNELPYVQAPKQMKVATPRCPTVAGAQIQTGRGLLLHLQHVEGCCVHWWTYFFENCSFWCSAASLRRAPGSFPVLHCAVKTLRRIHEADLQPASQKLATKWTPIGFTVDAWLMGSQVWPATS